MTQNRASPQLVLVVDAGPGAIERVGAACGRTPVAAIVIRAGNAREDRGSLAELIAAARRHGSLVLIQDDVDLARSLSADGVHLSASKDIEERNREARARLGRDAMIGIDAGGSRHDAMATVEDGADYVAFGLAASPSDTEDEFATRHDFVAWWAEIFEPPCVALDVGTPDEARELAAGGADFLAVTIAAGRSPAEVAEHVGAIAAAARSEVGGHEEVRTQS